VVAGDGVDFMLGEEFGTIIEVLLLLVLLLLLAFASMLL